MVDLFYFLSLGLDVAVVALKYTSEINPKFRFSVGQGKDVDDKNKNLLKKEKQPSQSQNEKKYSLRFINNIYSVTLR